MALHPYIQLNLYKAVFIIFPKLGARFNTHSQNAYANAFRNEFLELLRLSSNSIASTSREGGLVTAQLHCTVLPVDGAEIM